MLISTEKQYTRGFTLLELLVVIAIIGILSAVVLSYMDLSRDKAGDGGVRSNIINARSQAEVYFANHNNSYEGVCATIGFDSIGRQVRAAKRAYGGVAKDDYTDATPSTWNTEECHDSQIAYAVWVPLKASTNGAPVGLCIDSQNTTNTVTTVLGAGEVTCPAS